jgi:bla regulator protein BlaR1
MQVLIAIAVKSLLIAGLTLGLLALMKRRSAAERSWIAHIGLFALVIMAFAPLVLPNWTVEAPALLGQAPTAIAPAQSATAPAFTSAASSSVAPAAHKVVTATASQYPSLTPVAVATAAYALPAALLLLVTFLALARLIALRARADVLVDGHWLTALARAQKRMGFKHGTALLTSNALASPISWGLMRPVILLNSRAVEASGEAEAIIAHELAHVARMDWAKLLLARVATALFWFNPLVWMLAREAHQLREETADDAVLASDIADTDYAQLLVGVARHECPGLLLGAHGVAPSKNSLARRVARVLDVKSVRGPAARPFALGVFAGAVLVAAPLTALTLTPGGSTDRLDAATAVKSTTARLANDPAAVPADLPHIIAHGVSTSVATAVAAVQQDRPEVEAADIAEERADAAREAALDRAEAARDAAIDRAQAIAERVREQARAHGGKDYAMKAVGVTPEYVAGIRAAAPQLARTNQEDFVSMKAVGVTPAYVQELASAGLSGLSMDQLMEARAIGLNAGYVREVLAAGARRNLDELIELRTLGITPAQIANARRAGARSTDDIIEMIMTPKLKGWPFEGSGPPGLPPRTGRPAAPPPDGNPDG